MHGIMEPAADITIVISSFNREDKILRTVQQLFKSDLEGFNKVELIVIDDGSPSPVAKVLENMGTIPGKIAYRLITQKNAGIGATRNRGFREAASPVVIFLDDDILVEVDTIKKLYQAQQSGPGPVIFGNYPFISHASRSLKKFAEELYGYDSITKEIHFERVDAITSGLLVVNKARLNETAGFYKDDLTVPAAEEYEIIARFHKKGIPIYRAGHISAIHNHHLELGWLVMQQYKYGQGAAEAFIKYPGITGIEKFAGLKAKMDALGKKGIKNRIKKVAASATGRKLLSAYARLVQRLSGNKKHNFLFGFLASAYFWAGYREGWKKFNAGTS
jgi:glycosyltransferase involved in cell wall biosynthesis